MMRGFSFCIFIFLYAAICCGCNLHCSFAIPNCHDRITTLDRWLYCNLSQLMHKLRKSLLAHRLDAPHWQQFAAGHLHGGRQDSLWSNSFLLSEHSAAFALVSFVLAKCFVISGLTSLWTKCAGYDSFLRKAFCHG